MSQRKSNAVVTLAALISSAHNVGGIVFGSDVVKAAADKVIQQKNEQAVAAVQGLIGNFQTNLQQRVATLRDLREREKAAKQVVDDTDRAYRYFAATGNPLPMFAVMEGGNKGPNNYAAADFCRRLGIAVPKADAPAWSVPSDWTPPADVA